jgi:RimJ/RimL family protein N-acetyltransferase
MTDLFPSNWQTPSLAYLTGQHVSIARVNPDADVDDLYAVSHGSAEYEALWMYLSPSPFPNKDAMRAWLHSIKDSQDPLYYTVTSHALQRKVGMISIMNIVPAMGRAELGNIWYSPLAQKTRVNTEVTYLFLRYLFDDLRYRRVEWKCNNLNEPSKRAALRMGFKYEGLFRQHMLVKGQNRDTAWFSIIDSEWPTVKANFERYLSSDNLSLTVLNQQTT